MVTARRVVGVLAGALVVVLVAGNAALAQTSIDPTVLPVRNTGGWIFWLGWLSGILALLLLILLVAAYMRFAPRFAKDEEGSRFVHADRVLPGKEPPRRLVDLTQAAPIVVQPPPIPAAVAAPAMAAPAAAPAPAPWILRQTSTGRWAPTPLASRTGTSRCRSASVSRGPDRSFRRKIAPGCGRTSRRTSFEPRSWWRGSPTSPSPGSGPVRG